MKNLHAALKNLKYDTRMIDWNIKKGLVKKEEVDGHLKQLSDLESQKVEVTLEDDGGFEIDDQNMK